MKVDKIILGEGCRHDMDSQTTGLNNNIFICACTGAGKTMSVVEPQLVHSHHSSLIVVVSKRALVERYSPILIRRGYKVLDLNFAHPEESQAGYDPLAYVKTSKDVTSLAKALVYADKDDTHRSSEPYWGEASHSLFSAIIALVHQNREQKPDFMSWDEEEGPTFNDVLTLYKRLRFTSGQAGLSKSTIDHFFDEEEMIYPDNLASQCWRSVKNLPTKTVSCIHSTTNVTLDKVFTPEVEQLIANKNKIDLTRLAKEKTVLFVTVSAMDLGQQAFTNIFYADVFRNLFDYAERCPNGELPIPVHIICDDFACAGKIVDFENMISIMRAKKISVSLLCQSEAQLEYIYGAGQATTILNNCDTYVYMGGTDLKTCQNIALRVNMPLDEVLYMPLDRVIVFQRGKRPVITERYNIVKDELYLQAEADYQKVQRKKADMEEKEIAEKE